MRILAIDTSGEACSAALLTETGLHQRLTLEPRRHADLILGLAEGLLKEANLNLRELDALAFGRGPGSFAGVRIATGVVQGAAFAADIPVVPVSTLAALAQGHLRETGHARVLAALDARMNEVYWAACTPDASGLMRALGGELIVPPSDAPLPPDGGWHGVGSGWGAYAAVLAERVGDRVAAVDGAAQCRARDIASIAAADFAAGLAVPAEQALPVYLRDRVAWKRS